MKYLIKGGQIYDGTLSNPLKNDILIDNGIIEAVSPNITAANAELINAEGLVVTPGFIDIHRHCDIASIYDEDFGKIELAQGISSIVMGNCGLGIVPSVPKWRKSLYDFVEPCLGKAPDNMYFENFKSYSNALSNSNTPININYLATTGAITVAVKGFSKKPFTKAELLQATDYVKEAMEAGALGISMGIMYTPECYSSKDNFIALAKTAAKKGGVLSCHIRGEGDSLLNSIEEIIDIANKAEIALNISHFKATGIKNWNCKIFQAIEMIEKARSIGQDISVDFYPYTGGATTLLSLLPPSISGNILENLARKEGKDYLKKQLNEDHVNWDNMAKSIGWDRIFISGVASEENRRFAGKNIAEIASAEAYEDAADFVCDLLVAEKGQVSIIIMSMSQDDVDTVAKLPYSIVISDSLYGNTNNPHPRLYGSFPKIIRDYVVERKILSLEEAIYKMTKLPAKRMNLSGRGEIKKAYVADINIFNPEKFRDNASFKTPNVLASGLDKMFIAGTLIPHNS